MRLLFSVVEKLKSHPLFEGMDNIALESEITKVIERKTYIQEENLFQTKYDGPQYIYFISCGKFKLIAASSPMNNPKMQANFAADSEKGSGDIIGKYCDSCTVSQDTTTNLETIYIIFFLSI